MNPPDQANIITPQEGPGFAERAGRVAAVVAMVGTAAFGSLYFHHRAEEERTLPPQEQVTASGITAEQMTDRLEAASETAAILGGVVIGKVALAASNRRRR